MNPNFSKDIWRRCVDEDIGANELAGHLPSLQWLAALGGGERQFWALAVIWKYFPEEMKGLFHIEVELLSDSTSLYRSWVEGHPETGLPALVSPRCHHGQRYHGTDWEEVAEQQNRENNYMLLSIIAASGVG